MPKEAQEAIQRSHNLLQNIRTALKNGEGDAGIKRAQNASKLMVLEDRMPQLKVENFGSYYQQRKNVRRVRSVLLMAKNMKKINKENAQQIVWKIKQGQGVTKN